MEKMDLKAPVGIEVTTYEINDQGDLNPTLSHIGWGKDLQSAFEVLKSHLITDDFFSASFVGQLPWKGTFLRLTNDGKVLLSYPYDTRQHAQTALHLLTQEAYLIQQRKEKIGRIKQLQILIRE